MRTLSIATYRSLFTAAIIAFAAATAQAVSFNMLSCCPGEDTATQARFVWHSDSGDCKLCYAKASSPSAVTEVQCNAVYKPVSFRSSDVNYYKYTATLSSLDPGTEYIYYVKSGSTQSATQRFKTAGTSGSYNFLWMSDVHSHPDNPGKMNTLELLRQDAESRTASSGGIDFVLFSGDAVKYGSRYDNWQQWNGAPTVTNYTFALVPGNKEYYYTGSSTFYDYYWYLAVKNNPPNGPGTTEQEGCYWFLRDSVLFVGIDSLIHKGSRMTRYGDKESVLREQTNWFDRVVSEQKNRKSFRYLVVVQHDPWFVYAATKDSFDKSRGNYDTWRHVFDKHKVDLALSGDEHNYIRTKPLRGDSANSEGTVYMVAGQIEEENYSATITKNISSYGNANATKYFDCMGATDASCGAAWIEVRPTSLKVVEFWDKYQSPNYKQYDSFEITPKDRGFEYGSGGGDDPPTPTLDEYTWKGGYDNNRIGSGRNWVEGVAPTANSGASLTFPFTSNTTVSNDYASLAAKKITFPPSNYRASFVGGPVTIAECMVNNASVTNKFKSAVTFSGNIDVTGEMDFPGGITGTVPANHTTYRGNYNLTTTGSWTPASGSRVPSDSTLSLPNGTFYCHVNALTIERNATVTVGAAKMDRTSVAYLLGENDGVFKTTGVLTSSGTSSVYHYLLHTSAENSSEGLIALDGLKINGSAIVYANSYGGKYQMAIGNNGIKKKQGASGYFLIRNDGKPEYIGSWCNGNDYKIAVVDSSGSYPTDTSEYVLYGSRTDRPYNINFDTTDCFNAGVRNTVRDMSPICGAAPAKVSVGIYGGGEFRFENTAVNATGLYSGGTVVSNSATVAILAGSCPGRGDLALRDTATLSIPNSASGTANVFGTLSLASGTTVSFGRIASGTTPLSVGALSVAAVSGNSRPLVTVDCSGLAAGTYTLVESAAAHSTTVDSFRLQATGAATDIEASLVKSGNDICLRLSAPPNVWTGLGGNGNFSNGANWLDGNAPVPGVPLDLSRLSTNATLNVNIPNAVFPKLVMGGNVVTFTGSITVAEITDTSKVAVGANATVTLDGDLVFANPTNGKTDYIVNKVNAGGTFVVTGVIESSAAGKGYVVPAVNAGDGTIVAEGLIQNSSCSDNPSFRIVRDAAGTTRWVVGAAGIVGTKDYWMLNNGGGPKAEIKPDASDFTVSAKIGNRQVTTLTFDTTGRDGAAHVITLTGGIYREGKVVVAGTGSVVCDYALGSSYTVASSFAVKDTATFALKSGSNIGTGAVTMQKGTTLALDATRYQFNGKFSVSGGSGKVAVKVGEGTLARGTHTVFSATSLSATSDDFTLASAIPRGCKAEFSVSGNSLVLSVEDVDYGFTIRIR